MTKASCWGDVFCEGINNQQWSRPVHLVSMDFPDLAQEPTPVRRGHPLFPPAHLCGFTGPQALL